MRAALLVLSCVAFCGMCCGARRLRLRFRSVPLTVLIDFGLGLVGRYRIGCGGEWWTVCGDLVKW